MILFEDKVSPEFVAKVKDIAYKLGVDANWLMFIISYETGGTFDPSIQNSIGATGLIQFLPSTAIGLGTTTDALKKMSAVDQLDYVYQYLNTYKGKMDDIYSTYQAVFVPISLNQPDTYVFDQDYVTSNPSFFTTGNTLADFKKGIDAIVYKTVPTEFYDVFFKNKSSVLKIYQHEIVIVIIVAVLLIILYLVLRQIIKTKN